MFLENGNNKTLTIGNVLSQGFFFASIPYSVIAVEFRILNKNANGINLFTFYDPI